MDNCCEDVDIKHEPLKPDTDDWVRLIFILFYTEVGE